MPLQRGAGGYYYVLFHIKQLVSSNPNPLTSCFDFYKALADLFVAPGCMQFCAARQKTIFVRMGNQISGKSGLLFFGARSLLLEYHYFMTWLGARLGQVVFQESKGPCQAIATALRSLALKTCALSAANIRHTCHCCRYESSGPDPRCTSFG